MQQSSESEIVNDGNSSRGCHSSIFSTVHLLHRHWIQTAITPGVTSCDTAHGEPRATDATMNLEGLKCIGRAAWLKAATASTTSAQRVQERRDQPSVEMNEKAEQKGHSVKSQRK